MRRVILFVFAGRRPNMELQLPFIRRILKQHPNTEYHVWDLALTEDDHHYLQSIHGDRITIHDDLYHAGDWHEQFNEVYRHYTNPQYQDCLFVKLDEDVVFIEADQFGAFIDTIDANRGSVISAKIINNDVYGNADRAHNHFFEHWRELIDQPIKLMPPRPWLGDRFNWLSINMVGFDWHTERTIASVASCDAQTAFRILGVPPNETLIKRGRVLREFNADGEWGKVVQVLPIGDEGAANLLPRLILQQGFLACHLYFVPQRAAMTDDHIADLQGRYAEIGQEYRKRNPL